MTDDTYALELDALENWERLLARLDNMLEDLPGDLGHHTESWLKHFRGIADSQVSNHRNKLFPQEK